MGPLATLCIPALKPQAALASVGGDTGDVFMSELQRLKGLLPPEMQSWVFVEAAASADPPLITIEEIGTQRRIV